MQKNQYRIAVIPGDGIGKEVVPAALTVLDAVCERHGINLNFIIMISRHVIITLNMAK